MMRRWMRASWRQILVSGFGGLVLVVVVLQSRDIGLANMYGDYIVEHSGLWAIRFLLISLLMTPLNTLLGWRWAIGLRKTAGLWAFGFALLHFVRYLSGVIKVIDLQLFRQDYVVLGLVALGILTAMALTSHRFAMKRMGKRWKQLHRLVYAAGIVMMVHALVAYANTKRAFMGDQRVTVEVLIYLVVLAMLLMVRVRFIREAVGQIRGQLKMGDAPATPHS